MIALSVCTISTYYRYVRTFVVEYVSVLAVRVPHFPYRIIFEPLLELHQNTLRITYA